MSQLSDWKRCTRVPWYSSYLWYLATMVPYGTRVRTRVRTRLVRTWPECLYINEIIHMYRPVRTYNVMSQRTRVALVPLVRTTGRYHGTPVPGIAIRTMLVPPCTYSPFKGQVVFVRIRCTYVRTYNVMSQLSDWKRAHMCTENHVCYQWYSTHVRTYTCTML